ncbi:polyunsaturated fatty acid lipoxygenase ALOX15B [Hypomesus transpacificus]|uniref:polyunsaturated fatty acid lipoxygenase ALOX15B n=1 Tax=Hypomesus transpacificus TaxID=137520 RepID=UPI001F0803ED|nr:polyunsaturated fatty acid lipoxygenase ALOX15B [Hypomesus transpacificus]
MASPMEEFQVSIHTSPGLTSGTYSNLWIALIGSEGETLPLSISLADQHLLPGSVCVVKVKSSCSLGHVVLVRLRLEPRPGFPDLPWKCCFVGIQRLGVGGVDGEGQPKVGDAEEIFPCGRWLTSAEGEVELRNGTVCLLSSESEPKLRDHRVKEMQNQKQKIGWRVFFEGAPHCVDVSSVSQLGPNLSYTRQSPGINLHYLRGFTERAESWRSFEELDTFFKHNGRENSIAKYVQAHWREDWFFGYQCQNGCNPLMIRQTRLLPPNMAVTSDMLRPFLPETSTLEHELEKGTIFLLDYEVLEDVPANVINGRQQYLSAPLCLLHLDQQGKLKPVAIQLQQNPGPQNPVFLPSDPACDWLLAKMWVRSADFQCHQLASHFLRTHLLGEVYCIATLRQLPEVHPLFQLLMPHIRTTLQINIQARASLLAPNGVFDKAIGCGLASLPAMLSRSSARLHYRSLCVPDDLEDRGLAALPHCYYAQDALRVWSALHRFVLRLVELYYHGDQCVKQDSELQSWIMEIYTHGFLQKPQSGCPQSFQTMMELSKFVTMVIFSCSALHAAVNFSQMDFDLWMPNCPASMTQPPPQTKGTVTEDNLFSFLPEVNSTCSVIITLSMLSVPARDYVPLCQYREPFFSTGTPCRLVEEVQAELRAISDDITNRNRKLEVPYPYLSPDQIENSTAI